MKLETHRIVKSISNDSSTSTLEGKLLNIEQLTEVRLVFKPIQEKYTLDTIRNKD